MAWIPSHQELRDHPKARKAARRAGVGLPAMIGHLHLLWWWALDHGPDGDLSRFDADDLADAAMWDGDPEAFVKALRDCGPGGSEGFLTGDGRLHDWDDYGGKYGKRVQAARKAAAARWHSGSDADAMRTHSEGNADASGGASGSQGNRNAEERRREESREPSSSDVPSDPEFDFAPEVVELTRLLAKRVHGNGHKIPKRGTKAHRTWFDDVRKLIDLDEADPAEVRRVIEWATSDDFWRSNIRSAGKLREKFSQLRIKAGQVQADPLESRFFGGVPE